MSDEGKDWPRVIRGEEFAPGDRVDEHYSHIVVSAYAVRPDADGRLAEYGGSCVVGTLSQVEFAVKVLNREYRLLDNAVFYKAGVEVVYEQ